MLIFRSNTGTSLLTLRGNAETLKFKSHVLWTHWYLAATITSQLVLDFIQNECITAQLLFHVDNINQSESLIGENNTAVFNVDHVRSKICSFDK